MPKMPVDISFHFLKKNLSLSNRKQLKEFLVKLARTEGSKLHSLNFVFCSDQYLFKINKKFLNHSYYTDIITFPLSIPGRPITAEIYISTDRVRENAKTFKTSLTSEAHRVIFHGVLHLCGFKDKSPGDIDKMRQKENKYLTLYFKHSVSRGTVK